MENQNSGETKGCVEHGIRHRESTGRNALGNCWVLGTKDFSGVGVDGCASTTSFFLFSLAFSSSHDNLLLSLHSCLWPPPFHFHATCCGKTKICEFTIFSSRTSIFSSLARSQKSIYSSPPSSFPCVRGTWLSLWTSVFNKELFSWIILWKGENWSFAMAPVVLVEEEGAGLIHSAGLGRVKTQGWVWWGLIHAGRGKLSIGLKSEWAGCFLPAFLLLAGRKEDCGHQVTFCGGFFGKGWCCNFS